MLVSKVDWWKRLMNVVAEWDCHSKYQESSQVTRSWQTKSREPSGGSN